MVGQNALFRCKILSFGTRCATNVQPEKFDESQCADLFSERHLWKTYRYTLRRAVLGRDRLGEDAIVTQTSAFDCLLLT
jgi:hypothetical protein